MRKSLALNARFLAMAKDKLKEIRINPSRIYLRQFVKEAAQLVGPKHFVLDAGAGDCPYRDLFTHTNYHAADSFVFENFDYGKPNFVCDLTAVPVATGKYDVVICTQVLEHMLHPQMAIDEFYRILRPGGHLWLSTPLYYSEHQAPHDYYRFTQYGLRHILQSGGFRLNRLDWLEGYYGTLSYQFELASAHLPLNSSRYGGGLTGVMSVLLVLFLRPFLFFLSLLFSRLDIRYKNTLAGHCKNYAVVATKPTG